MDRSSPYSIQNICKSAYFETCFRLTMVTTRTWFTAGLSETMRSRLMSQIRISLFSSQWRKKSELCPNVSKYLRWVHLLTVPSFWGTNLTWSLLFCTLLRMTRNPRIALWLSFRGKRKCSNGWWWKLSRYWMLTKPAYTHYIRVKLNPHTA